MANPQTSAILHHLRQTVLRRERAGLSDGHLLRAFLYRGEEAAFEELVRRHGPMVRGVCRRVLRNLDDADDAFQAAFLVLLRKASTLAMREVIGDWLHGVAYRTALKARAAAARRRLKEKQALRPEAILDNEDRSEWLPLLDEEIGRLPQKYRLPVVLCDLEGRTRKGAAQQLGWPEGTLSGRLSRARAMLARRLTRRGVTLSAAAMAAGMASEASARVPFSLIDPICKAAMGFAAGSAAGAISAPIAALTEGVVKAMFLTKLKNAVALAMVALVLTASAGAWRYVAVAGQNETQPGEQISPPKQKHPKGEERKDRAKIPRTPFTKRTFRIDLRLVREKDGQRKVLAAPRKIALEGKEASFRMGPGYLYTFGQSSFEQFDMGPSVHLKVYPDEGGKVGLLMTVHQPTLGTFAQDVTVESRSVRTIRKIELGQLITAKLPYGDKDPSVLEVTAAVHEAERDEKDSDANTNAKAAAGSAYSIQQPDSDSTAKKKLDANTIAAAEKDLKIAEFYRGAGPLASARFYYELICSRYPRTPFMERAKKRLAELKEQEGKLPAHVGQIFIIGNETIPDETILEQVKLYPGQILSDPDLRTTEKNLSRIKGLKSKPKVTVLDREGDSVFKDIEIRVEEK